MRRGDKVLVIPQHPRVEPALEQVPCAAVPPVEPLCMDPVDPVQRPREPGEPSFEDGVEVVVHHAVEVQHDSLAPRRVAEERDEPGAVDVVPDDRAAVDPTRGDVEDPALGKRRSWHAGHTVEATATRRGRHRLFWTCPGQSPDVAPPATTRGASGCPGPLSSNAARGARGVRDCPPDTAGTDENVGRVPAPECSARVSSARPLSRRCRSSRRSVLSAYRRPSGSTATPAGGAASSAHARRRLSNGFACASSSRCRRPTSSTT